MTGAPPDGPAPAADPAPEGREPRSIAWQQAATLVAAVLIALALRTFLVEPFRIPSGSMIPTLLVGDHLFVNKLVYGARLPGTSLHLPALREPRRGEVVVFAVAEDGDRTYPADLRPDLPREEFVKRIIGLPGDRIDIRDGAVFVNGKRVTTSRDGERMDDGLGRKLDVLQASIDGRDFRILDDPDIDARGGRFRVEPGRYFMLGDNRDYSKDSRVWGTVRRQEIEGPAFLLYWSWDFTGGWLELASPATWWNVHVRWDRVGRRIL